jgi:hypothetical protein
MLVVGCGGANPPIPNQITPTKLIRHGGTYGETVSLVRIPLAPSIQGIPSAGMTEAVGFSQRRSKVVNGARRGSLIIQPPRR